MTLYIFLINCILKCLEKMKGKVSEKIEAIGNIFTCLIVKQ